MLLVHVEGRLTRKCRSPVGMQYSHPGCDSQDIVWQLLNADDLCLKYDVLAESKIICISLQIVQNLQHDV